MDAKDDILDHIGIEVTKVNLLPIRMDADSARLFELAETTKRENAAAIARAERAKQEIILKAEGDKAARLLAIDAEEEHVERVLIPTAKTPGGAFVRAAEAHENNKTATTVVVGSGALPVIGPSK